MTETGPLLYPLAGKRVWVAGHRGMVGSAIVRRLATTGCEVLTAERAALDLCDQARVFEWMSNAKPQAVFVAAAKVGGILANASYPIDFLYQNIVIASNIIEGARRSGVEKLMYLGSSCIYPKLAPQPIPESAILTGPLEPTNEWYAVAKIAGIKLCQAYRIQAGADFISAMPTNLYGPGDNYELASSHVIPALMRKAHEAKVAGAPSMEVWGSGTPMREFLHADDCADALVFLMERYSGAEHVNVGSGVDMTIRDLAIAIMQAVGYAGDLRFDTSKPDGTPRKLMAADKIRALGWRPSISLSEGLRATYADWLRHGGADSRRAAAQ